MIDSLLHSCEFGPRSSAESQFLYQPDRQTVRTDFPTAICGATNMPVFIAIFYPGILVAHRMQIETARPSFQIDSPPRIAGSVHI